MTPIFIDSYLSPEKMPELFSLIFHGVVQVTNELTVKQHKMDPNRQFKFPLLTRVDYAIFKGRPLETGTIIRHTRIASKKPYMIIKDDGYIFYSHEEFLHPTKDQPWQK